MDESPARICCVSSNMAAFSYEAEFMVSDIA